MPESHPSPRLPPVRPGRKTMSEGCFHRIDPIQLGRHRNLPREPPFPRRGDQPPPPDIPPLRAPRSSFPIRYKESALQNRAAFLPNAKIRRHPQRPQNTDTPLSRRVGSVRGCQARKNRQCRKSIHIRRNLHRPVHRNRKAPAPPIRTRLFPRPVAQSGRTRSLKFPWRRSGRWEEAKALRLIPTPRPAPQSTSGPFRPSHLCHRPAAWLA